METEAISTVTLDPKTGKPDPGDRSVEKARQDREIRQLATIARLQTRLIKEEERHLEERLGLFERIRHLESGRTSSEGSLTGGGEIGFAGGGGGNNLGGRESYTDIGAAPNGVPPGVVSTSGSTSYSGGGAPGSTSYLSPTPGQGSSNVVSTGLYSAASGAATFVGSAASTVGSSVGSAASSVGSAVRSGVGYGNQEPATTGVVSNDLRRGSTETNNYNNYNGSSNSNSRSSTLAGLEALRQQPGRPPPRAPPGGGGGKGGNTLSTVQGTVQEGGKKVANFVSGVFRNV